LKTVSQRFSATIFTNGINPCVDVPARVSKALTRTGYIPVRGTLDGSAFRAGLVSLGGGRHRLFINGEMRKAAGVETGDRVTVVLDYDPEPRNVPTPPQLTAALNATPAARKKWLALPESGRKEALLYLNSLKREETVQRIVQKLITRLLTNAARRHAR